MPRRSKASDVERRTCQTAEDVHSMLRNQLDDLEQEQFWVLCVDARMRLLSIEMIHKGTAHSVEVHPRDVFRRAIRSNAAGIALAHNHPSGDPTPSPEDLELTRRLVECGRLLGIPVIDHVVMTSNKFRSLAELYPLIMEAP